VCVCGNYYVAAAGFLRLNLIGSSGAGGLGVGHQRRRWTGVGDVSVLAADSIACVTGVKAPACADGLGRWAGGRRVQITPWLNSAA